MPSWLGAVHPRFKTTLRFDTSLYGSHQLALSLSGSFVGMLKISAVARLVPYVLTCLAVPALRKKHPQDVKRFRLKGGPVIPILAVVLSAWLLNQSPSRDLLAAAVALAAGYALYGGNLVWRRRKARLLLPHNSLLLKEFMSFAICLSLSWHEFGCVGEVLI